MKRYALSVLIGVGLTGAAYVSAQPSITTQPNDTVGDVGGAVAFSVRARPQISGDTLTYQWSYEGVALEEATSHSLQLTDLTPAQKGSYTATVTDSTGSITSCAVMLTLFAPIRTGNPVVEDRDSSQSGSWADFDGDGDLDLFVGNGVYDGTGRLDHLFRNDGGGVFTKLTAAEVGPIVDTRTEPGACVWADYDNDGHLDVYLADWGESLGPGSVAEVNYLYRNNGDGTFSQMANAGPLVTEVKFSWGAAWADYDRDGFVDLFVGDARDGHFTGHLDVDSLYHNEQNGVFTRDDEAGVSSIQGRSQTGSWADYDQDGDPDLVLSHSINQVQFVNNGDRTFTEVTSGGVPSLEGWTIDVCWGDFSGDGWLDLAMSRGFLSSNSSGLVILENTKDGDFTVGQSVGLRGSGWSPGVVSCADYDNDGDLDLFVARGEWYSTVSTLFQNDGSGSFTAVATTSISTDSRPAIRGLWGDYDNNGFPDLVVVTNLDEQNTLYRNEGNANHYVVFSLVGTRSNRSGIGAKVHVLATIRGESRWQVREIKSNFSDSGLRAHFGLGDAESVEAVRIQWPSGITHELGSLQVDQFLTITEPPHVQMSEPGTLVVLGGREMTCEVFGSQDLVDWTSLGPVTLSNDGTATFQDEGANGHAHRFYYVEQ